MSVDVFEFEEDAKVVEDIKREVEDIKMKLKVEAEDVKIGEVVIEDLKYDQEALLQENDFEGELSELAIATDPHPRDLLVQENVTCTSGTRKAKDKIDLTNGTRKAKNENELCNLASMPCQREDLEFCQETFDLCFLRTVELAERNQWREIREKLSVVQTNIFSRKNRQI